MKGFFDLLNIQRFRLSSQENMLPIKMYQKPLQLESILSLFAYKYGRQISHK